MNEIILVIMKVLPIILILLLGVWMKKIGFVSADTVRGMKKITLSIALPCILFLAFFKAEMKPELLILSVVIFAACLLEVAMGFLIKKLQKSSNQFYPSLFTTFLTGPIGYPIFMAYFGAGNLYKLAILDVGNSIFIFTVLTVFLCTVSCSIKDDCSRAFKVGDDAFNCLSVKYLCHCQVARPRRNLPSCPLYDVYSSATVYNSYLHHW